MIARDIDAGAGSDSAVVDGTGVSVSTRSVPSRMPDALAAKRSHLSMQPGQAGSVATETSPADKAGELLVFRPRRGPRPSQSSVITVAPETGTVIVIHGGREFRTTGARAESFLVWARAVARSGRAALVPLGHTYGVDLLLITSNTRLP